MNNIIVPFLVVVCLFSPELRAGDASFAESLVRLLPSETLAEIIPADLEDGEMSQPLGPRPAPGQKPPFDLVLYVNGQNVESDSALGIATALAEQIKCPVRLVYNNLTVPVLDWISTAIEKTGGADSSVNEASDTLIKAICHQIESGQPIHLVGHSAGVLSIQNAVNEVAHKYRKLPPETRNALLARIHVLGIGGASFHKSNVFSDGWPKGLGSIHDLRDKRDGVANFTGQGDFTDVFDFDFDDDYHAARRYIHFIDERMLSQSGRTVIVPKGVRSKRP